RSDRKVFVVVDGHGLVAIAYVGERVEVGR
ncbi:MAG: hypothetical protein QG672_2445, partial [Pseudomonadota bacterium]|nr:hypothetical protein [Pseudomonadota bacterium]